MRDTVGRATSLVERLAWRVERGWFDTRPRCKKTNALPIQVVWFDVRPPILEKLGARPPWSASGKKKQNKEARHAFFIAFLGLRQCRTTIGLFTASAHHGHARSSLFH